MTQPEIERPLPALADPLNAEFYARCADGTLCFQRCSDCGRWRHVPRILCPECGSRQWKWSRSSGRGRLVTWTVTHQPRHPFFARQVPYVVAVIETEEGVRLVSQLRGLAPEELELDLAVVVELEKIAPEIALPYFRRR